MSESVSVPMFLLLLCLLLAAVFGLAYLGSRVLIRLTVGTWDWRI